MPANSGLRHRDLAPYNENCSDVPGGMEARSWEPGGMEAWRHTWADNDDESDGVDAKMDDEDGCWEDFPHARRSERSADSPFPVRVHPVVLPDTFLFHSLTFCAHPLKCIPK